MNNIKTSRMAIHHGNDEYNVPRAKVVELQRTGLLAEAGDWWHHPSGSYSLAPIGHGISGGKRVQRARVVKGGSLPASDMTICPQCGKDFERTGKRHCSYKCVRLAQAAA